MHQSSAGEKKRPDASLPFCNKFSARERQPSTRIKSSHYHRKSNKLEDSNQVLQTRIFGFGKDAFCKSLSGIQIVSILKILARKDTGNNHNPLLPQRDQLWVLAEGRILHRLSGKLLPFQLFVTGRYAMTFHLLPEKYSCAQLTRRGNDRAQGQAGLQQPTWTNPKGKFERLNVTTHPY